MELGRKAEKRVLYIIIYLILGLGSVAMLFPLFWAVSTSLKTPQQLMAFPPEWIPRPPIFSNYVKGWTIFPFNLYLKNTLIIVSFCLIGELFSASLVAYGFAYLRFPGREVLFLMLLSVMIVPAFVRLIPLFIVFSKLGWVNTYLPLIFPSFFGPAFYIFLLRQFFRRIPRSFRDAAKIDGASELRIWGTIMLPLLTPALAVIAIFSFQAHWNDFVGPLIYLSDAELRTLTLGLYSLRTTSGEISLMNFIQVVAVIMVIPLLVLFSLFQKYFFQEVSLAGLKG